MGLEGHIFGLGLVFVVGLIGCLYLAVRQRRKMALAWAGGGLLLAAIWFALPMNDFVESLLFFPDDTIYAPGYSENAFRKIGAGQLEEEVLALLGEPLEKKLSPASGHEYWYYSEHGPRYQNFWNKIVIFDPSSERVSRKIDDFYSD
jgi:hypothetical protein